MSRTLFCLWKSDCRLGKKGLCCEFWLGSGLTRIRAESRGIRLEDLVKTSKSCDTSLRRPVRQNMALLFPLLIHLSQQIHSRFVENRRFTSFGHFQPPRLLARPLARLPVPSTEARAEGPLQGGVTQLRRSEASAQEPELRGGTAVSAERHGAAGSRPKRFCLGVPEGSEGIYEVSWERAVEGINTH